MEDKYQLEKRLTAYLNKVIVGFSKDRKKVYNRYRIEKNYSLNELEEKIDKAKLVKNDSYILDEIDVNYLCPEKAFTDFKYYKAMKKVPSIQSKVLYLLKVERISKVEVAKLLHIKENKINKLKKLSINNFKKNLEEIN